MVRTTDFNKLRDNAKKVEAGATRPVDERFYKLDRNDEGNAFALIRFLPQIEGEDTYYAMHYNHYFTEGGKTFNEMCPTAIGEPCPVCETNREHWNSYTKEQQNRKRKVRYVTNILVVKDKENPEREGQVFLYEYGIKIHKKITNTIYDNDEEGTKGYDVFDFKTGKNFKLKVKTVSDFPNYDDSEFVADPSPIADSDKKIDAIDKKIYSLAEFIPTKEKMKSYAELKSLFLSKIGGSSSEATQTSTGKVTRKEDKEDLGFEDSPSTSSKGKSKNVVDDEDTFFTQES